MNKKDSNSTETVSKKFDISKQKENTINSLFEVENFLGSLKHALKYFKLYKILK